MDDDSLQALHQSAADAAAHVANGDEIDGPPDAKAAFTRLWDGFASLLAEVRSIKTEVTALKHDAAATCKEKAKSMGRLEPTTIRSQPPHSTP